MSQPIADAAQGDLAEPFSFHVERSPSAALRVLSFRGREAISRPYRFDVRLATDELGAEGLAVKVLGEPAWLRVEVPGREPRLIHGVVSAVWAEGVFERGHAALTVRLVPGLKRLKDRRTSRIFQDKSVPEIVAAVLDGAGVAHRSTLLRRYPLRVYCVQHQETDLAFVQRLLAEEGIFYFFEQTPEGEVVVLADSARRYPLIKGSAELAYRWGGGDGLAVEEHHVTRFALRRAVTPGAALQRDYDFRRPTLDLRAVAGGAANDIKPEQAHIYDHHGTDEAPGVSAETAAIQLEQHRRSAVLAEGSTTCRRLAPGHCFTLHDHDVAELDQTYVVASVTHTGRAPAITQGREHVYEASFTCAPAPVPLRPARPKRRIQQVTETAIVVGPEGEEIYADEHGRVKVQFHWDLEGNKNEHSSCWIRVSQAWAGTHWGFQFIPRIGMEVVVTFLGGDTDRPLITGCVPNAVNPPPFKLPEQKTKSGIRTRSTPDGQGYNELSFEDRRGMEQITLRAERDMSAAVGHDHTLLVGHDQTAHVKRDRRCVTGGTVEERVGGDLVTFVTGRARREIKGPEEVAARDDVTLRVRGCHTTLVGTSKAKRSYVLHVEGITQLTSSDVTELRSDKAIVLTCGASSLRIGPERVEIIAPAVVARGGGGGLSIDRETVQIKAEKQAQITADKVLLKAEKASMGLYRDAQIDGERVLLNSPSSAVDPLVDASPPPTRIALVDQKGRPLAGQRFLVSLHDGAELSGVLDKEGKASIPVEGNAAIRFLGVRGAKRA